MELTLADILIIINLVLTTLIPPLTIFFTKIRKSSCVGKCLRCGIERDTNEEYSPLVLSEKNNKKNASTTKPAEVSFKREKLSQRLQKSESLSEVFPSP